MDREVVNVFVSLMTEFGDFNQTGKGPVKLGIHFLGGAGKEGSQAWR